VRGAAGAPLGEVFAFLSGLYFRGKLAYSRAFGHGRVITSARGLLSPDDAIHLDDLRRLAEGAEKGVALNYHHHKST